MSRSLALACGLVAACGGAQVAGPRAAPIGLELPALDGGTASLDRLRGQVVVVHVFATWSVAAQLDVEQLAAADLRPDVAVVGVALDPDGHALVAPWRAAASVHYLIALADDAVRAGTSPLGPVPEVPVTLVLDPAGRVVHRLARQLAPGELDRLVAGAR